jgi:hypothetical protein
MNFDGFENCGLDPFSDEGSRWLAKAMRAESEGFDPFGGDVSKSWEAEYPVLAEAVKTGRVKRYTRNGVETIEFLK